MLDVARNAQFSTVFIRKRQLEMESELQSLQKANLNLENLLEATKACKRQEVSQLNKIHAETLKVGNPKQHQEVRSLCCVRDGIPGGQVHPRTVILKPDTLVEKAGCPHSDLSVVLNARPVSITIPFGGEVCFVVHLFASLFGFILLYQNFLWDGSTLMDSFPPLPYGHFCAMPHFFPLSFL